MCVCVWRLTDDSREHLTTITDGYTRDSHDRKGKKKCAKKCGEACDDWTMRQTPRQGSAWSPQLGFVFKQSLKSCIGVQAGCCSSPNSGNSDTIATVPLNRRWSPRTTVSAKRFKSRISKHPLDHFSSKSL